jgi:hypothetical protein
MGYIDAAYCGSGLKSVANCALCLVDSDRKSCGGNRPVLSVCKEPSWQHLRTSLLADTSVCVSSLDRQLTALHDGDLRIVHLGTNEGYAGRSATCLRLLTPK